MINLKNILVADFYKITRNKLLLVSLWLPLMLVLVIFFNQKEGLLKVSESGYDVWVILCKDSIVMLSFLFSLYAIVLPFVIFDSEHRYHGFRSHIILPLKIRNFYLSKQLILCFFLFFCIATSTALLLIIGYTFGAIYDIPEFILYKPTFIIFFAIASIIVNFFILSIQILINIFFNNFLITVLPFLMLLFFSFFLTDWKYSYLNVYCYPFLIMQDAYGEGVLFLKSYILVSFIGFISLCAVIYYLVPKIKMLWIK
ncbi:membrane hypothetical protein [Sphingobacterium sp. PM2-P1-29]|jgi:hypothetical protein|nr:hypothetical protein L950_0230380 [Sphingobacterium sp. IITKGP-BTPF85]CDT22593.1 membrane hypothetical protein [Sphingobacterium sp. PM2-P1-29]